MGRGVGRMRLYQRATGARRGVRKRIGRFAPTVAALGMFLVVSGCLDIDKPELALDIPESYKTAHATAESGKPALDWWRSFHSPELTSFMEQATTANFDIAVAIAPTVQADAQMRIAGAPLLPSLTGNANDTASKASLQIGG